MKWKVVEKAATGLHNTEALQGHFRNKTKSGKEGLSQTGAG
jgi:hypothetical protein